MGALKIVSQKPESRLEVESIRPLGVLDPRNPFVLRNQKLLKVYQSQSSLFFALVGSVAPLTYLLFHNGLSPLLIGFIGTSILGYAMKTRLELVRLSKMIKEKTVQLNIGDRLLRIKNRRGEFFQVVDFGFNHYYLVKLTDPHETVPADVASKKEKTLLLNRRRVHKEFHLLKVS